MKVTLLIPTLNEVEGMKVILPKIRREWVDEILVIDANSTDGSFEYAQSLGIKAIRQKSKGLSNAYREALEVAKGDVIIPFSPDGNSVPERIPELVAKMKEGYDMVIVSRYLQGAKSADDTLMTGFGNWLFTAMINGLYGGHYTDSLVMYRAWKKDLIKRFHLDTSLAGFEPQLAILCAKHRLKVTEIPGDEPARLFGTRKTDPIRGGLSILRLIAEDLLTSLKPQKTAGAKKTGDSVS
jgi:glycosyltransferase involved in cell wall biosynthesis